MIAHIQTKLLLAFCDPFGRNVWGMTVSRQQVLRAIEEGRLVSDHINKDDPAGRIAYLVLNKAEDPIEIDVGSLGCFNEWIIIDGNHRFAAALLRGDPEILCHISGEAAYIEHFFAGERLNASC